jgi:hypothetical protein
MAMAGENHLVTSLGAPHQFSQLSFRIGHGYSHFPASVLDHHLVHILSGVEFDANDLALRESQDNPGFRRSLFGAVNPRAPL